MKRIIRSLNILLVVLILSLSISVSAVDTVKESTGVTSGTVGECTWSFNSGTLTISGNGSMGADQGNSYPWKDLGDSITSVVIGYGVTDVSGHAFLYQQKIASISISNTVTNIGAYAFGQCWVTSVMIPDSVKTIGNYAFHGCWDIKNLKLGSGVQRIGTRVFWNCYNLESVTIPKSVNIIGTEAFACGNYQAFHTSPKPGFIMYGYPSSAAEEYAENTGISFRSVDNSKPMLNISASVESNYKKISVSISADDDGILSGYYWGNSDNYNYNEFKNLKKKTITSSETIAEAGAYYCVAKDTSGKVSDAKSVVVSKALFDANGGYIDRDYVIYLNSESFEFPVPERNGYTFLNWERIDNVEIVDIDTGAKIVTYIAKWKSNEKQTQKITAKSYTKSYGLKAFNLNAKTSGNGKLSYKISNKKVATISSKGKVSIKGCGKATITIKATATSKYKAASKKITITVKPGKVKFKNKKIITENGVLKVKQSFAQQKNCDGYQVTVSYKTSANLTETYTTKYPKTRKDFKFKALRGRKYTTKIRAYKKIGKKTYYGTWNKKVIKV